MNMKEAGEKLKAAMKVSDYLAKNKKRQKKSKLGTTEKQNIKQAMSHMRAILTEV